MKEPLFAVQHVTRIGLLLLLLLTLCG